MLFNVDDVEDDDDDGELFSFFRSFRTHTTRRQEGALPRASHRRLSHERDISSRGTSLHMSETEKPQSNERRIKKAAFVEKMQLDSSKPVPFLLVTHQFSAIPHYFLTSLSQDTKMVHFLSIFYKSKIKTKQGLLIRPQSEKLPVDTRDHHKGLK